MPAAAGTDGRSRRRPLDDRVGSLCRGIAEFRSLTVRRLSEPRVEPTDPSGRHGDDVIFASVLVDANAIRGRMGLLADNQRTRRGRALGAAAASAPRRAARRRAPRAARAPRAPGIGARGASDDQAGAGPLGDPRAPRARAGDMPRRRRGGGGRRLPPRRPRAPRHHGHLRRRRRRQGHPRRAPGGVPARLPRSVRALRGQPAAPARARQPGADACGGRLGALRHARVRGRGPLRGLADLGVRRTPAADRAGHRQAARDRPDPAARADRTTSGSRSGSSSCARATACSSTPTASARRGRTSSTRPTCWAPSASVAWSGSTPALVPMSSRTRCAASPSSTAAAAWPTICASSRSASTAWARAVS